MPRRIPRRAILELVVTVTAVAVAIIAFVATGEPVATLASRATQTPQADDDMTQAAPTEGPDHYASATFSKVRRVFGAACTFSGCHTGRHPKRGLSLEPDRAYQDLVNVVSQERPDLRLVAPGDPGASYLLHKITGAASIEGRRMPRESPPLSDEEIQLIEHWIARGAPND